MGSESRGTTSQEVDMYKSVSSKSSETPLHLLERQADKVSKSAEISKKEAEVFFKKLADLNTATSVTDGQNEKPVTAGFQAKSQSNKVDVSSDTKYLSTKVSPVKKHLRN